MGGSGPFSRGSENASNQRCFPKNSPWEAQVRLPEGERRMFLIYCWLLITNITTAVFYNVTFLRNFHIFKSIFIFFSNYTIQEILTIFFFRNTLFYFLVSCKVQTHFKSLKDLKSGNFTFFMFLIFQVKIFIFKVKSVNL